MIMFLYYLNFTLSAFHVICYVKKQNKGVFKMHKLFEKLGFNYYFETAAVLLFAGVAYTTYELCMNPWSQKIWAFVTASN